MSRPYDYAEHRHRFAAWAACRAASVSSSRFPVSEGRRLLEASGIREMVERCDLPEPAAFDVAHRGWREALIGSADFQFSLSHGVAAKLINCYLKSAVVLGYGATAANHSRAASIHPPIDRLLLETIKRRFPETRQSLPATSWSKFTSEEYQTAINVLRPLASGGPFWMLEEHWVGHQ